MQMDSFRCLRTGFPFKIGETQNRIGCELYNIRKTILFFCQLQDGLKRDDQTKYSRS